MEINSDLLEEIKVLDCDSLKYKEICRVLAQDINLRKSTIMQLVQNLEGLLLDTHADNRAKAIYALSNVFKYIAKNSLDDNHLIHILNFFCDKFKDHHQVIPAALEGILNLITLQNVPEGSPSKILRAIFNNIVCQQQQQQDRMCIYLIFERLLENYENELVLMGVDLVYGIISAIDGERDPKNLQFVYNWIVKFFKIMDLKHLTEEAFEIFACYFPVDFKAPRQDPNDITRDTLANSLAYALTARPDFAELCLPLALEKLDATLEVAQIDSLKLLEIGCETFNTSDYVRHFSEIWSKIYENLIKDASPAIQLASLNTISRIIAKISTDPSLKSSLSDILSTVKRNLITDSKYFRATAQLLIFATKASRPASEIVVDDVVPQLLNTFSLERDAVLKANILKLLIDLFDGYIQFHDTVEFDDLKLIFILCASSLESEEILKIVAYNGVAQFSCFLPKEVRAKVYASLKNELLQNQRSQNVRHVIENCFVALANQYPEEIRENLIVGIVATDLGQIEIYLGALFLLLPQKYFSNFVLETLFKFLANEQSSEVAIKCLCKYLEQKQNDRGVQQIVYANNIIEKLLAWSKLGQSSSSGVSETSLENMANVMKIVIGYQEDSEQEKLLNNYYNEIYHVNETRMKIALLDGLICRVRKEIRIDFELLRFLLEVILSADQSCFARNKALLLLANLINKCQDEPFLDAFLDELSGKTANCDKQSEITAWITKALLMRKHKAAEDWILKMIELLKRDENLASHFQIVLLEDDCCLSVKSYCNQWLFYRQKFFVFVTDILVNSAPSEIPPSLIGYLLLNAPKAVVSLEFKKIFNLLLQCLNNCDDQSVLTIILECFKERIIDQEVVLNENMGNIVSVLLKLGMPENCKTMKVRILSLQCLQAYAQFPLPRTIQYQTEVLKALKRCIDDKKRIVRKEATEAILLWTMIDMTD